MNSTPKNHRRTRRFKAEVRSVRIEVSLRTFRTSKAARSRLKKQVVLPLRFLRFKEIAIVKTKLKRRQKRATAWKQSMAMLTIGIVGVIYFGAHLQVRPELKPVASKQVSRQAAKPTAKYLSASQPQRIRIADIDLNASVQPIGLKADGSLNVPADPGVTGWYNGSPTPGEIGPSVIDGHVDKIGGIAVFWRLRELQPGQIIEIDRADGSTARFKVDSLKMFSQSDFPTQEVYGNINYAGLRLITCGGIFNTATGHYSDNLVIFATLIS